MATASFLGTPRALSQLQGVSRPSGYRQEPAWQLRGRWYRPWSWGSILKEVGYKGQALLSLLSLCPVSQDSHAQVTGDAGPSFSSLLAPQGVLENLALEGLLCAGGSLTAGASHVGCRAVCLAI